MSFIFAKNVAEVLDAALQPMETAPPSADITANVPSMA